MIPESLREVLDDIELGWSNLHLRVGEDYIQIWDENLPIEFASGRKWRISQYMSRSEVVQTVFAALMAWWEHETREAFLYRGRAVFGPHLDVEALHEVADRHEYREPVAV